MQTDASDSIHSWSGCAYSNITDITYLWRFVKGWQLSNNAVQFLPPLIASVKEHVHSARFTDRINSLSRLLCSNTMQRDWAIDRLVDYCIRCISCVQDLWFDWIPVPPARVIDVERALLLKWLSIGCGEGWGFGVVEMFVEVCLQSFSEDGFEWWWRCDVIRIRIGIRICNGLTLSGQELLSPSRQLLLRWWLEFDVLICWCQLLHDCYYMIVWTLFPKRETTYRQTEIIYGHMRILFLRNNVFTSVVIIDDKMRCFAGYLYYRVFSLDCFLHWFALQMTVSMIMRGLASANSSFNCYKIAI